MLLHLLLGDMASKASQCWYKTFDCQHENYMFALLPLEPEYRDCMCLQYARANGQTAAMVHIT